VRVLGEDVFEEIDRVVEVTLRGRDKLGGKDVRDGMTA
jgi:hypothetical protein